MLILAAVSIATLTGENGILTKANDAEMETRGASVQEARNLWKINQEADKLTDNKTVQELEALLNDLESQKLITQEERATIEKTGQVTIGSRTIVFDKFVEIGDYVAYNPMVSDKNGTLVESNKLSYSSPRGSASEHGNGRSVQNFTATADTKWRVLSIENGTVELISENAIKTNDNSNFWLKGAIGYLYAEQELNEVCKIFGYGYGADTTKGGTYTNGGPVDTPITGKIEGTGARSITIEDINKKAGIYEDKADGKMKDKDGTVISFSSYGSTENPPSYVYYPTMDVNKSMTSTGLDGVTLKSGASKSAGVKNLKDTSYGYDKSKIENTVVQNMLFNEDYWLPFRWVRTDSDSADFSVQQIRGDHMDWGLACSGKVYGFNEIIYASLPVRALVTLVPDVLDVDSDYDEKTGWKLK